MFWKNIVTSAVPVYLFYKYSRVCKQGKELAGGQPELFSKGKDHTYY
jgi:hypothetical protein